MALSIVSALVPASARRTASLSLGAFCALASLCALTAPAAQAQTFTYAGSFSTPYIPQGIAVDSANNLYVSNINGNSVVKYDRRGNYFNTISDRLYYPCDLAFDSQGNLYVSNILGGSVVEFDKNGDYLRTPVSGLLYPDGVSARGGDIFVNYGTGSGFLSRYDASGSPLWTVGGVMGGEFSLGVAVAQNGNVYAAGRFGGGVKEFDSSGNLLRTFGGNNLSYAYDIAVDKSGNVFATDFNSGQVVEFSSSGNFIQSFGSGFNGAAGLAFDSKGNLFVEDYYGRRVVEYARSAGVSAVPEPGIVSFLAATGFVAGGFILRRRHV